METTFEPSFPSFRNRMAVIEAIELPVIGFFFWGLLMLIPSDSSETFSDLLLFLVFIEVAILFSWLIYNGYIRIARAPHL